MHAAAHGQVKPVLPREPHGSNDVADLLGRQHRQRAFVEHAVMNRPRLVVALVLRRDHSPAHLLTKSLNSLSNSAVLWWYLPLPTLPLAR